MLWLWLIVPAVAWWASIDLAYRKGERAGFRKAHHMIYPPTDEKL